MWVYEPPGDMALTCTLSSRTSSARHSTKRTTAALEAALAEKLGREWPDPGPAIAMILPARLSIIPGSAARHELTTPSRSISMASLQALGFVESSGPMG